MHDLLTDTLPTEWEGRAINWDFRPMIWLLIRTRRAKTDEDSARMICEAVQRFFVEPVPGVQYQEAFESLVRFCQGGGPEDEERTGTGSSSDPQDEPVLDYRCDADYIVGAFQQAYGIDLTREKLHWFRFRALFAALPEDTLMAKIMSWRTMDLSEYEGSMRDRYADLQERFALPAELRGGAARVVSVEEHDAAFLARFRH